MADLLPCPFCGGEPELVVGPFWEHLMQCSNPSCREGCWQGDAEQAATAWNARYNVTPPDGLLASMALRYRHDFGILPADEQRTIMAIMRQIHEEVVGKGFYSVKDEDKFKRALNYGAMDELSKIDQELGLYDES